MDKALKQRDIQPKAFLLTKRIVGLYSHKGAVSIPDTIKVHVLPSLCVLQVNVLDNRLVHDHLPRLPAASGTPQENACFMPEAGVRPA